MNLTTIFVIVTIFGAVLVLTLVGAEVGVIVAAIGVIGLVVEASKA
jgi:hypothetical protein